MALETSSSLNQLQLDLIEKKRQKALALRQGILLQQEPLADNSQNNDIAESGVSSAKIRKVIDSGAGFLLEEEVEVSSFQAKAKEPTVTLVHPQPPLIDPNDLLCEECDKPFVESSLLKYFELQVCDECKDDKEAHKLVTRTVAKERYLLNDVDLDKREPFLKFMMKPNPHNKRWGNMKLYLEAQIAERALEVWQTEEALEEERERRVKRSEVGKKKKYVKEMKEMRLAMKASSGSRERRPHEHEYGEEVFDSATDEYHKTCVQCGYVLTYEKL